MVCMPCAHLAETLAGRTGSCKTSPLIPFDTLSNVQVHQKSAVVTALDTKRLPCRPNKPRGASVVCHISRVGI